MLPWSPCVFPRCHLCSGGKLLFHRRRPFHAAHGDGGKHKAFSEFFGVLVADVFVGRQCGSSAGIAGLARAGRTARPASARHSFILLPGAYTWPASTWVSNCHPQCGVGHACVSLCAECRARVRMAVRSAAALPGHSALIFVHWLALFFSL